MTREEIEKEFDRFIEWPSDSKQYVTAVSARLFAEHCVRMADRFSGTGKMIPERYVLVPKEPTEKMVEAGDALWDHHCTSIYEAMIQTAQEEE